MSRTWRDREELEHQVVTLHGQRVTRRGIARACGVSRNTVKKILIAHATQREQEHTALPAAVKRAPRPKKIDTYAERVAELMKGYEEITAQRVFEILREEGFDGGYTAVKTHVSQHRPVKKPKPSLTAPDYGPGEMAESDWSPYEIKLIDGSILELQAFDYALAHCGRKYYAFFESNDLHALMDGHVQAFSRFEGCARQCKYDGQKPVLIRWEGRQPIYNLRFVLFATHYEFRPQAVHKADHKPHAERSFWELEQSFFNGRSFIDFADLQRQLARWLDTIADLRKRHGTTPLERFEQERPHLLALPSHHYDTARVAYRVCSIDGFVDWGGNRYAVPYEHITDILPIRVTQSELFVYAADLKCIAKHEIVTPAMGKKVDPSGYHPAPRRQAAIDLDQLRDCYAAMGEGAKRFFHLMSMGPPRGWAHAARQTLTLRKEYTTEDLDKALAHAASYGAFDANAVERILVARCNPRTLDELVTKDMEDRLSDTRLAAAPTRPRDLKEYDRMPRVGQRRGRDDEQEY